jgi:hypothetical protein
MEKFKINSPKDFLEFLNGPYKEYKLNYYTDSYWFVELPPIPVRRDDGGRLSKIESSYVDYCMSYYELLRENPDIFLYGAISRSIEESWIRLMRDEFGRDKFFKDLHQPYFAWDGDMKDMEEDLSDITSLIPYLRKDLSSAVSFINDYIKLFSSNSDEGRFSGIDKEIIENANELYSKCLVLSKKVSELEVDPEYLGLPLWYYVNKEFDDCMFSSLLIYYESGSYKNSLEYEEINSLIRSLDVLLDFSYFSVGDKGLTLPPVDTHYLSLIVNSMRKSIKNISQNKNNK